MQLGSCGTPMPNQMALLGPREPGRQHGMVPIAVGRLGVMDGVATVEMGLQGATVVPGITWAMLPREDPMQTVGKIREISGQMDGAVWVACEGAGQAGTAGRANGVMALRTRCQLMVTDLAVRDTRPMVGAAGEAAVDGPEGSLGVMEVGKNLLTKVPHMIFLGSGPTLWDTASL